MKRGDAELLGGGDQAGGKRRPRGVLILIHDPSVRPPPAPQIIGELFNLPPGTAALLAALAAGDDLAAYAERNAISMNTVRFHLKTAYTRTGARRSGAG